jgi:hypothetical protein
VILKYQLEYSNKKEDFNVLLSWSKILSNNKVFEIESYHYSYYLAEFYLNTNIIGSDHAGPSVEIGVLGYILSIKLYDTRHWDEIKNNWV